MVWPRRRASSRASRSASAFLIFSATASPLVEKPLLVVAEDFIIRAVVQQGTSVETLDDLPDAVQPFLCVQQLRLSALLLNLFLQGVSHGFRDAGAAPARQFAGEPLSLRVVDVQGHAEPVFRHLPPASYKSSFFLLQHKSLSRT